MAIFQTGASTSIPNLLDTLAAFAVANGWTQNFNAVEGAGRRVHLQLGSDVFINLRALVAEYSNTASYSFPMNGIAMNGSTGYNGAVSWCRQPGAPAVADANNVFTASINGVAGAIPTYYMFARGNMIYLWVEYSTGQYQWLAFGRITKTSTWTGGMFIAGTGTGFGDSIGTSKNLAGTAFSLGSITPGNPNAYLYGIISGLTGWMRCDTNTPTVPNMPHFFDTTCKEGITVINLANTFNGQSVLPAIEICITRDGAVTWADSSNFSIEGVLPDIYYCNLRYLLPGQQLDDGSGNIFRVLPFRFKTTDGSSGGWLGVAIKEN